MSKLDPRPSDIKELYSWDVLNSTLQTAFKQPGEKTAVIDLRQFSLTKEEIVTEAESQGYTVTEEYNHYLRFR
ncbi:hypothetical protein HF072_00435 [Bacillus sp. RO3]|nr:hypothetical protein [Bacillus sp. RO3]